MQLQGLHICIASERRRAAQPACSCGRLHAAAGVSLLYFLLMWKRWMFLSASVFTTACVENPKKSQTLAPTQTTAGACQSPEQHQPPHSHTRGILSVVSPSQDDITHTAFSTFSHTITSQQKTPSILSTSRLKWQSYNYSNQQQSRLHGASCTPAYTPQWKIGTAMMDGPALSRPLDIIICPPPISCFTLTPSCPHQAWDGSRHPGRRGEMQQINVGKHSRNCHFSSGYLSAKKIRAIRIIIQFYVLTVEIKLG